LRASEIRLVCCLCEQKIPSTTDVCALDAEWHRRYPAMTGSLACNHCVYEDKRHFWKCSEDDQYPQGHVPSRTGRCYDSTDHVDDMGSPEAIVMLYPQYARQQGAEDYLRAMLRRPGLSDDIGRAIKQALHGWR
jgi:hypothetical protein